MAGRIPPDAFALYASMGSGRSYEKLAEQLDVSKRAVTDVAVRERWQERVAEVDRLGRARAEERTVENMSDLVERHARMLRVVQARGLETLKSDRIPPAQAARTVLAALREERELRMLPVGDHVRDEAEELSKLMIEFTRAANAKTQIDVDDDDFDDGDESVDDAESA